MDTLFLYPPTALAMTPSLRRFSFGGKRVLCNIWDASLRIQGFHRKLKTSLSLSFLFLSTSSSSLFFTPFPWVTGSSHRHMCTDSRPQLLLCKSSPTPRSQLLSGAQWGGFILALSFIVSVHHHCWCLFLHRYLLSFPLTLRWRHCASAVLGLQPNAIRLSHLLIVGQKLFLS